MTKKIYIYLFACIIFAQKNDASIVVDKENPTPTQAHDDKPESQLPLGYQPKYADLPTAKDYFFDTFFGLNSPLFLKDELGVQHAEGLYEEILENKQNGWVFSNALRGLICSTYEPYDAIINLPHNALNIIGVKIPRCNFFKTQQAVWWQLTYKGSAKDSTSNAINCASNASQSLAAAAMGTSLGVLGSIVNGYTISGFFTLFGFGAAAGAAAGAAGWGAKKTLEKFLPKPLAGIVGLIVTITISTYSFKYLKKRRIDRVRSVRDRVEAARLEEQLLEIKDNSDLEVLEKTRLQLFGEKFTKANAKLLGKMLIPPAIVVFSLIVSMFSNQKPEKKQSPRPNDIQLTTVVSESQALINESNNNDNPLLDGDGGQGNEVAL